MNRSLLKTGLLIFVLFFLCASALYFAGNFALQGRCVFGTFEGSSSYHCMFPYQYIAVLCIATALVIPFWIHFFYKQHWIRRYLALVISFICIIILASVFGGILWATHEWIVVGDHRGMGWPRFYWFEIKNTLIYGWQALLKSFPLNLIILTVGVLALNYVAKKISSEDTLH